MVQALLWEAIAAASFAASAALVFAIARLTDRADPAWWPEFERAFADYVRAGETGRR